MKTHGSMALIGALDYKRMRSCGHMKVGSFAIKGILLVFGGKKKKLSILMLVMFVKDDRIDVI
jgi:hypothetical protein